MQGLFSPGALLGRLKYLLGGFYTLFPLAGSTGGIIVREKGGTPNSAEVQMTHDGNTFTITNKSDGSNVQIKGSGNGVAISNGFSADSAKIRLNGSQGLDIGAGSSNWDVSLYRTAANVFAIGTGSNSGSSWIQNTAGEATLASAFTDATGTLAATNLSLPNMIAGRSYRIEGYLIVSNTLAADGFQFNFAGGTATATNFDVSAQAVGSDVAGTLASTSLAGVLNYTTITGTNRIWVRGILKVNGAGTLTLKAATNTTVSGTATLAAGSWIAAYDTITM